MSDSPPALPKMTGQVVATHFMGRGELWSPMANSQKQETKWEASNEMVKQQLWGPVVPHCFLELTTSPWMSATQWEQPLSESITALLLPLPVLENHPFSLITAVTPSEPGPELRGTEIYNNWLLGTYIKILVDCINSLLPECKLHEHVSPPPPSNSKARFSVEMMTIP